MRREAYIVVVILTCYLMELSIKNLMPKKSKRKQRT